MPTVRRLFFFDNMRILMMTVVIAHHVAQPYGPTGSWWPIQETVRSDLFGPFFTVNRSFGMSLFFLIAGYFSVMALDSKGPRAFFVGRLLRLGVPLVAFSILMEALQLFIIPPAEGQYRSAWPLDVGHMWFVQHLLLYSLCYLAWRVARKGRATPPSSSGGAPATWQILAFALALAVASGIVRTWFPIDHWDYILGWFRVAFADVPRDLGMFIVGLVAYRRGWVHSFSHRTGMAWLRVGVALSLLFTADALVFKVWPSIEEPLQGALYAVWESLLCCSLCIGFTVLFRDALNRQWRPTRIMADGQYAAYIIHIAFVFLVQWILLGMAAPPLVKFALGTLFAVPLSFGIGYLIRRPLRL